MIDDTVLRTMSTEPGARSHSDPETLLRVQNLSIRFDGAPPGVNVVDEVSFSVAKGKTLCLVGESGCGKSVTALSLMGLLPTPPARLVNGVAHFRGKDLFSLPERERADMRGNRTAMIFQEPMTSLNPAYTVGDQIMEGILRHRKVSRPTRGNGPSTCSGASGSLRRKSACGPILMRCRAACVSGS